MPYLRNYHILISHSWTYFSQYNNICSWLNESNNFLWSDYSVCCNNPLDTKSDKELMQKLENRIANCSCIIVISGMYATYSRWIDFEIETAKRMNKPIIGVKPWGQERIPVKIQDNSTVLVGWNSKSIVSAVREYAL